MFEQFSFVVAVAVTVSCAVVVVYRWVCAMDGAEIKRYSSQLEPWLWESMGEPAYSMLAANKTIRMRISMRP